MHHDNDSDLTPTKRAMQPKQPPTSLISPSKNEINATFHQAAPSINNSSWNTFDSSWADGEFESIDEPGTGE
jgi:hypothetical protein